MSNKLTVAEEYAIWLAETGVTDSTHFCEVIPDGIDFDIECGCCGYTERNVDTSYGAARQVADAHEQTCNGEGK